MSLLAIQGVLFLCPMGCGITSDLQNYAQILETGRHPELFAADPLVHLLPRDPGVPNLLTMLAELFPADTAALSLILAGGPALFCQLFGWYVCATIFFRQSSLAAILSLVCSITWYWCFGTYWGAAHAEPLPRIFYNALWPFLLLCACKGLDKTWPRLVLCLITGCSVFVHSVSAFMCGGIFLAIFFLVPAHGWKKGHLLHHLASTAACVLLFALPVLCFLSLHVPLESPLPGAWNLMRATYAQRFAEDWNSVWPDLFSCLQHYSTQIPLLPAGLAAMLLLYRQRHSLPDDCRSLARLLPLMPVGMAAVCLACALEMTLAPHLGRMPMSQEILRGTRFLVPVCLLAITCVLSLYWRRLPGWCGWLTAFALMLGILLLSPDKMMVAARCSLGQTLGLPVEQTAARLHTGNALELEALQAIERMVPHSEPVFTPDNALSVRYVARHPLHPVHKDGNILYYARDYALATQWLREQQALAAGQELTAVWQSTETQWLLVRTKTWATQHRGSSSLPVFANRDWLLFHKEAVPDMSPDTVQATDAGS